MRLSVIVVLRRALRVAGAAVLCLVACGQVSSIKEVECVPDASSGGGTAGSGGVGNDAAVDAAPLICVVQAGDPCTGNPCENPLNSCGQACACNGFFYVCSVPIVGMPCDPARYSACDYLPHGNGDRPSCTCDSPMGEPFWECTDDCWPLQSVCSSTVPQSGDSCGGYPLGFGCDYPAACGMAEKTTACICGLGDGGRVFTCTTSG
jgi:hypothetical protein